MSDNAANETNNYTFTLPDGMVMKYLKDGWRKHGSIHPNIMDDFFFVMYPEVESRIRYLKDIKPGDIVVDVGACVGSWTIHAALKGAHVHAFEIGESQLRALEYNLNLNNIRDRVTIYDAALRADDTGEMLFDGVMVLHLKSLVEGMSMNLVTAEDRSKIISTVEMKPVKSITLDNWLKMSRDSISHIELIKIDVEGMELEVLRGAYHTLLEFRPNCVIEIHEAEANTLRYDVEKFMKDLGYKQKRVPGLNDYFYQ